MTREDAIRAARAHLDASTVLEEVAAWQTDSARKSFPTLYGISDLPCWVIPLETDTPRLGYATLALVWADTGAVQTVNVGE